MNFGRSQIIEYACLNLNSKLKIINYVSKDNDEETITIMIILYSNNNINKTNK